MCRLTKSQISEMDSQSKNLLLCDYNLHVQAQKGLSISIKREVTFYTFCASYHSNIPHSPSAISTEEFNAKLPEIRRAFLLPASRRCVEWLKDHLPVCEGMLQEAESLFLECVRSYPNGFHERGSDYGMSAAMLSRILLSKRDSIVARLQRVVPLYLVCELPMDDFEDDAWYKPPSGVRIEYYTITKHESVDRLAIQVLGQKFLPYGNPLPGCVELDEEVKNFVGRLSA